MKYLQTVLVEERGILTSSYKQEIKRAIAIEKRKSISSIKSLLRNHQGKIESEVGTILRVALFFAVIVLIAF